MRRLAFPLLAPEAAPAHPRVFVEAAMEALVDATGRVAGVRMTWVHDEFFTLMLTEDLGLDGDMALAAADEGRLRDHVLDWPADFGGDLQASLGGRDLPLAPRAEAGAALRDGRLVETHLRPLAEPAPATAGPVLARNFDPCCYLAHEVADVRVAGGEGCAARLLRADLDAAFAEVEDLYGAVAVAGAAPDVRLPPLEASFADALEVTSGG